MLIIPQLYTHNKRLCCLLFKGLLVLPCTRQCRRSCGPPLLPPHFFFLSWTEELAHTDTYTHLHTHAHTYMFVFVQDMYLEEIFCSGHSGTHSNHDLPIQPLNGPQQNFFLFPFFYLNCTLKRHKTSKTASFLN